MRATLGRIGALMPAGLFLAMSGEIGAQYAAPPAEEAGLEIFVPALPETELTYVPDERPSPEELELDRRIESIDAEIAAGGLPEWAGDFYYGDGLGVNVRLLVAPSGGFSVTWTGSLGLYDYNYGGASLSNGRVQLDFELPSHGGSFANFTSPLTPVRWGERLYLLGANQFDDFANAINAGLEPCTEFGCGQFLMRRSDRDLKVTGRPELPAIQALLLDAPIQAAVVQVIGQRVEAVGGDPDRVLRFTRVEISAGRNQGVWNGMHFYDNGDAYDALEFTVVEAHETHAIAEVRGVDEQAPAVPLGTCVSTRYWHNPCSEARAVQQASH